MKTTSLTLTLVRRISDGNYGTYGAELSETLELGEGDKEPVAIRKLHARMTRELDTILEGLAPEEEEEPPKKKHRKEHP